MYFIVDKIIFLFSAKFMVWCPYDIYIGEIGFLHDSGYIFVCITLLATVALWAAKKGHGNRKWLVSAIPCSQRQLPGRSSSYDIFVIS